MTSQKSDWLKYDEPYCNIDFNLKKKKKFID